MLADDKCDQLRLILNKNIFRYLSLKHELIKTKSLLWRCGLSCWNIEDWSETRTEDIRILLYHPSYPAHVLSASGKH